MEEIFIGRTLTKQEVQQGLRPHRNIIVNRKHVTMLNIWEQRVFFFCLGFFEEHSKAEKIRFTFQDLMGKDSLSGNTYNKLKAAVRSLLKITVMLKNTKENRYKEYNVFSHIEVLENSGTVEFAFVHNKGGIGELKERRLLDDGYTSLDFSIVIKLKNAFSYQIYALLKQGGDEYRQREFSIEDLKNKLGINSMSEFDSFQKFRTKVLEQSCKDINAHTEISVEWQASKKNGRRITHVVFIWQHDDPKKDVLYLENRGQLGIEFPTSAEIFSEAPLQYPQSTQTYLVEEAKDTKEEVPSPSKPHLSVPQSEQYSTYAPRDLEAHFYNSYKIALERLKLEIDASQFLSETDKEAVFHTQAKLLYEAVLTEQHKIKNFNPLGDLFAPMLPPKQETKAVKVTDFEDFVGYYLFYSDAFVMALKSYFDLLYPKFQGVFETYILENSHLLETYATSEEEATAIIEDAIKHFSSRKGKLYPYEPTSDFPKTVDALIEKINELGHSEKVKIWIKTLSPQEFETLLTYKELLPKVRGLFVQCSEFPQLNLRVAMVQGINLRKK